MSRLSLEEANFEAIKAHILDPDNSTLPVHLQPVLERTIQASKLLDKNPVEKNAVAILRAKYPNISRAQAYEDCNRAKRIFKTLHTFDYDYWKYWLVENIAELIQKAKTDGDLKAWAAAQKNLIMAIGEAPPPLIDPLLIQKNTFNLVLQVNDRKLSVDSDQFMKLPADVKALFIEAIDQPIDDQQAEILMNS